MILLIQNDPRVPAGLFGQHPEEGRMSMRLVRLFAGEDLPAPGRAAGIIVLGGYMGVHDEAEYLFLRPLKTFLRKSVEAATPLLGLCLGGQLLAEVLGAQVHRNRHGERGLHPVNLTPAGRKDPLFGGIPSPFRAFQWHNDSFEVPGGAVHLASSPICPAQAFRFGNAWGLQFHPEVDVDIVAEWSRTSGAGEEHAASFRREKEALHQFSRHLFNNFLAFADPLSAGGSGPRSFPGEKPND